MPLTVTQIRCLLALYSLLPVSEEIASKDAAKLLGVTKPAVHRLLDLLGKAGLTEKEHYGAVRLTETGLARAADLQRHKENLYLIFFKKFGLPPDECSLASTLLISGLKEESLQMLEAAV